MGIKKLLTISLVLGCLFLSGCASKDSRFFILNPIASAHGKQTIGTHITIGIEKIQLADYLEKPQIITRESHNELKVHEFSRWAEPLQQNIQHVMAVNLRKLLPNATIVVYPWSGKAKLNYTVKIMIHQFDSYTFGKNILNVQYNIYQAETEKVLLKRKLKLTTHTDIESIPSIVRSMNYNLSSLSQRLVLDIAKLNRVKS